MKISKPKQAVTCHAGNRDSYQLSVALYEEDLLDSLITDFYTPDFARGLTDKRYNNGLHSSKVTSLWGNLVYQKILKGSFAVSDARLSNYAAKRAIKNDSNLFLSSYTAYEAFCKIKDERLENKCLLFQLHPHPLSIRKIFEEEIRLVPVAKDSILGELEMNQDHHVLDRLLGESILADACVVASSFTKETLVENSIPNNKITVVPYGVDSSKFPLKQVYNSVNGSLNIIFVGQMIQRKGLFYLLEAIKKLNSPNVNLTIVGRGSIDYNLLKNYSSASNIHIKINVSHAELVNEFHKNDVLIFPSLVEGFGQVILEAMSSGLPVICTPNTAGRDLFLTGDEGIIVPIRSVDALVQKIEWCMANKSELSEMGRIALETAKSFTWEKFRKEIRDFYVDKTIDGPLR
jgi:glycosyltransferase involved in cell wall biosynthesis